MCQPIISVIATLQSIPHTKVPTSRDFVEQFQEKRVCFLCHEATSTDGCVKDTHPKMFERPCPCLLSDMNCDEKPETWHMRSLESDRSVRCLPPTALPPAPSPRLTSPDQWGLFGLALKTLTAVIRKHISVDQLGGKRFS